MRKSTKKAVSYAAIRRKLYSALAMLLVSSIMMVSSTYAWFVLSTAPEVTGIQTQVGSNGALEIALLNQESWNDLSKLDMGDIDESAAASATEANLTWGNLVDLDNTKYGLSQITLMPSRLNIMEDGTTGESKQYKVNSTLLKTPIYGEDGRVQGLDTEHAQALIYNNGKFDTTGYGVRAVGTAANMSVFQLGMNGARSQLITYMSAARTEASNSLNTNGDALANIVVQYALNGKTEGYTKDDIQAVLNLAQGLQKSLTQIEKALRQVYAGYITTASSGITTSEAYQAALEEINGTEVTLAQLKAKYKNASTVVPNIDRYVDDLITMQKTVQTAIDTCTEKIDGTATSFTWTEISNIVRPLANTDKMTVGGKTVDKLKDYVKGPDGKLDLNKALELVTGGIVISVPTGSGILSDIADYAGDYSCNVTVGPISYGSFQNMTVDATMTTATTVNPVKLTASNTALAGAKLAESTGSTAMTDFYGYAIDLAFRTNAENSHLLLQTEPENRIYEGSTENAALQGKGSYMTFTTQAGLSATKMVKLMSGIRIVFMDGEQKVIAMGALDTQLGQDVYQVLEQKDQTTTAYAYLKEGKGDYQKSDLIDKTEYNALPQASNVTFDKENGTVTAKLYLYNFQMTEKEGDDGSKHQTGGITINSKTASSSIMSLTPDTPQKVTALVYLDGSVVNNSMVAANSNQSMTGTLNLQFSSDATLQPASNTKLQQGTDD